MQLFFNFLFVLTYWSDTVAVKPLLGLLRWKITSWKERRNIRLPCLEKENHTNTEKQSYFILLPLWDGSNVLSHYFSGWQIGPMEWEKTGLLLFQTVDISTSEQIWVEGNPALCSQSGSFPIPPLIGLYLIIVLLLAQGGKKILLHKGCVMCSQHHKSNWGCPNLWLKLLIQICLTSKYGPHFNIILSRYSYSVLSFSFYIDPHPLSLAAALLCRPRKKKKAV